MEGGTYGFKKITSHCLEKQNDDVVPELLSFRLCVNGNCYYFIHLHTRAENRITARNCIYQWVQSRVAQGNYLQDLITPNVIPFKIKGTIIDKPIKTAK